MTGTLIDAMIRISVSLAVASFVAYWVVVTLRHTQPTGGTARHVHAADTR